MTGTGAGSPTPLLEPPRLRTQEDRTATRLELFFDLAYVLVVLELTGTFADDLGAHGALVFVGLFTVTWWSWVSTTLYANRFDTNDVPYRLAKLGQTFAVVVMAAAASGTVGPDDVYFALGYLGTRVLLVALYARAWRHVPEARRTLTCYLAGACVGIGLWSASLLVEGPARYTLWALGVAVEALAPPLATRFGDDVPLHREHLPERFGLLTILVLGESIRGIAVGLHETDWRSASFVAATAGFVITAAAWWVYFDIGGAAGKRELEKRPDDASGGRHDRYVYGHLPLLIGLAVAAVGVEEHVLHPSDGLADAARWALCGGTALFVLGTALVMAGSAGRWAAAWPWPLLAVPVVLVIGVVDDVPPAVTVSALALALVLVVAAGVRQQLRGRIETAETAET